MTAADQLIQQLIDELGVRVPLGQGRPFRAMIEAALAQSRNEALEEAAKVPVLATSKLRNSSKEYSDGWFDGVEACLDAIRALKVEG